MPGWILRAWYLALRGLLACGSVWMLMSRLGVLRLAMSLGSWTA